METTKHQMLQYRSNSERYEPFEIIDLSLFLTSLCNSRCQTCFIWENKTRIEIPLEQLEYLSTLPMLQRATWILLGGEVTIYSQYIQLVKLLYGKQIPYFIITNGILPEKIFKLFNEVPVPNLSISLDGYGERHDEIRGFPGNFERICQIIAWVKLHHPTTFIRLGYTASAFNTRDDLLAVKKFADEEGLDLKIMLAMSVKLFNSKETQEPQKELYQFEDLFPENHYLQLYRPWMRGWSTQCQGITHHPIILHNGDLILCQPLGIPLGNIYATPFDDLWNSKTVRETLLAYARSCRACWMDCQRTYDARKMIPEQIADIRKLYGC